MSNSESLSNRGSFCLPVSRQLYASIAGKQPSKPALRRQRYKNSQIYCWVYCQSLSNHGSFFACVIACLPLARALAITGSYGSIAIVRAAANRRIAEAAIVGTWKTFSASIRKKRDNKTDILGRHCACNCLHILIDPASSRGGWLAKNSGITAKRYNSSGAGNQALKTLTTKKAPCSRGSERLALFDLII